MPDDERTATPAHPDDSSRGAFTRRDFLARAGQIGAALSVVPFVRDGLAAAPVRDGFAAASPPAAPATPTAGVATTASAAGDTAAQVRALSTGLRWRMLGPFRGGRVDAACGVTGRPDEFYFGHVNGGVWKTIDAGRTWSPVFDAQPVASIGALAVAPSAPDTVYVGSGESTLRDSNGYGNGVYKSTDGGRSWTHLGLDETQHIGKVAVHPRDPNTVFVAAIGHLYAPNPERGVFRSKDGGRTWRKVLGTSEVGAVDVVFDPGNPEVLFAALWNARRPPWFTYSPTNGPGGGLYKSTDGGSTWKKLTKGLPTGAIGRSGIAVAPSSSRRVYAVIDCLDPDPGATSLQGGFFRSEDGGESWTRTSNDQALWGRGWYFEKLVVHPRNADVVLVPNVAVSRTKDGGRTWDVIRGSPGGDDYHQAWISPDDPDTMVIASDQGCVITRNVLAENPADVTWSSWLNQPTAQLYHLSVDYRFPYWVTAAQQDSGAVAVRSRGKFAEISMRDWEPIGAGGESGMTAGDPLHPGIVYGGTGQRYDLETNRPVPGTTSPTTQGDDRADWTQPLVISRADPRAMYYASQYVYKTTDGAKTWVKISGDLTRPDGPPPPNLDDAAAEHTDRNGKRGVVYTLCPSPLLVPMLWAGTDDGRIHVTVTDGRSWSDVTPREVGAWSRVTCVEASHFDFNTAYASVDRHQLQDYEPYIYRTRDQGRTWALITAGLPRGVYVHVVKEDPARQGLLFAGTERGAFVSLDDGDHWAPLQLNLPVTSVRDFEVYRNDLIVATHGRGFWVIDDVAALRQVSDDVIARDAYLFKPSDAINYRQGGDNGTPLQKDEPQADNPPGGAYIDYYLKDGGNASVTLDILDAAGTVVASFGGGSGATGVAGGRGGRGGGRGGIPNVSPLWRPVPEPFVTSAGMHRVAWVPVSGDGRGDRGGRGFGGGRGGAASLLTGTFTARLTVSGRTQAQNFTVRPDPRD